jgi:hypothetical protein
VALQAVDEIDLDLRVMKTGWGEPLDDLPAKRRDVDRSDCDHADLGAAPGQGDLACANASVSRKARCRSFLIWSLDHESRATCAGRRVATAANCSRLRGLSMITVLTSSHARR